MHWRTLLAILVRLAFVLVVVGGYLWVLANYAEM
jgi:hypothetical protein